MENKAHALAAGLFVIVVSALLLLLALWLMRDDVNTIGYELATNEAVSGLQPQAAVRFKGVSVGKVTGVRLDAEQRGQVLITLAVDANAPVTQSTYATLAFQGVTGLSYVLLDDDGSSTEPPEPGPAGLPRIPLRAGALGVLTDQVAELMVKVEEAADGLNEVLGPDNRAAFAQLLEQGGAAAGNANRLMERLDQTLEAQLDPARANLPALVGQATATFQAAESIASDVRRVLESIATVVSDARQGLARLTGSGGMLDRLDEGANTVTTETLPGIQELTGDASSTIRRLDRIANTIGDNPQVLLYGSGAVPPGPGEPGFVAPRGTE